MRIHDHFKFEFYWQWDIGAMWKSSRNEAEPAEWVCGDFSMPKHDNLIGLVLINKITTKRSVPPISTIKDTLVNIGTFQYMTKMDSKDLIGLVQDFSQINSQLKRSECPMPIIKETLVKMETFQWVAKMDLNLFHMTMPLYKKSKSYCELLQKRILHCHKVSSQLLLFFWQ